MVAGFSLFLPRLRAASTATQRFYQVKKLSESIATVFLATGFIAIGYRQPSSIGDRGEAGASPSPPQRFPSLRFTLNIVVFPGLH
jgi:hypothetical protein